MKDLLVFICLGSGAYWVIWWLDDPYDPAEKVAVRLDEPLYEKNETVGKILKYTFLVSAIVILTLKLIGRW